MKRLGGWTRTHSHTHAGSPQAMRKLDSTVHTQEIADIMAEVDLDGNGVISYEELLLARVHRKITVSDGRTCFTHAADGSVHDAWSCPICSLCFLSLGCASLWCSVVADQRRAHVGGVLCHRCKQ